jgi:hypothetical protein
MWSQAVLEQRRAFSACFGIPVLRTDANRASNDNVHSDQIGFRIFEHSAPVASKFDANGRERLPALELFARLRIFEAGLYTPLFVSHLKCIRRTNLVDG